jgi:hypothetical protein
MPARPGARHGAPGPAGAGTPLPAAAAASTAGRARKGEQLAAPVWASGGGTPGEGCLTGAAEAAASRAAAAHSAAPASWSSSSVSPTLPLPLPLPLLGCVHWGRPPTGPALRAPLCGRRWPGRPAARGDSVRSGSGSGGSGGGGDDEGRGLAGHGCGGQEAPPSHAGRHPMRARGSGGEGATRQQPLTPACRMPANEERVPRQRPRGRGHRTCPAPQRRELRRERRVEPGARRRVLGARNLVGTERARPRRAVGGGACIRAGEGHDAAPSPGGGARTRTHPDAAVGRRLQRAAGRQRAWARGASASGGAAGGPLPRSQLVKPVPGRAGAHRRRRAGPLADGP